MTFFAEYERRLTIRWTDIQDQLPALYDRARRYDKVRVFELGTRTGESTTAFLAAAEAASGHVWSVDVDPPAVPLEWLQSPLWSFLQADDTSAQAQVWLPAECDVLFIDTSHDYHHTFEELRLYVPRVAPGGLVLCHDTKLTNPPFDPLAVARALDDYCAETGRAWLELGGQFGLGEIQVRAAGERAAGSSAALPGVQR